MRSTWAIVSPAPTRTPGSACTHGPTPPPAPIYANLGGSKGSKATFYLSQVEAVHAGKNMRITLNDRKVTLDIKLPTNLATAYGGKDWWQVRYTVGDSTADRTTWTVNIVGNPVHLVGG